MDEWHVFLANPCGNLYNTPNVVHNNATEGSHCMKRTILAILAFVTLVAFTVPVVYADDPPPPTPTDPPSPPSEPEPTPPSEPPPAPPGG